ncbi:hypothetical protein M3Y98_00958900 [Aphelenchoides besseyi]|nr:hypothetical protein M3Y98_00958900 [Aphelenchoides besseyi]KAI6194654.1 hypothetical protein M3Y96_01147500 [Aphelenchoides besseyi]
MFKLLISTVFVILVTALSTTNFCDARNITRHIPNTNETIDALLLVYHNMTHKQQVQLDAIAQNSNETEDTFSDKITDFVDGLNGKLQSKVTNAKDTLSDLKADVSEKVDSLGNEAKGVFEKVHGAFNNASQTLKVKYENLVGKITGSSSNSTSSQPDQQTNL